MRRNRLRKYARRESEVQHEELPVAEKPKPLAVKMPARKQPKKPVKTVEKFAQKAKIVKTK